MAGHDDLSVLCKPSSNDNAHKQDQEERRCQQDRCLRRLYLVLLVTFMASSIFYGVLLFRQFDECTLTYPPETEICHAAGPHTPEQLHLSLGANDSEYYVTWSTMEPTDTFLVWVKADGEHVFQVAQGTRTVGSFDSDSGPVGKKYRKYSYRAKMSGSEMVPNERYWYRVVACDPSERGTEEADPCPRLALARVMGMDISFNSFFRFNMSAVYEFSSKPYDDSERELNFIFYGDLGLLNAQSVPRLVDEIKDQDLIIHNGDFAYDLNTKDGQYGDRFMRLMEPIAAKIPYQTSVGNHEIAGNFSEYNHRFTMINRGAVNHGEQNNFFYSFNAGPVHFVAFSTEFYYFLDYVGKGPILYQYNWLIEDLKHASSPAERAKRPWIVVFGHRPMYCSSRDGDDCSKEDNILRKGLPFLGSFALEKLFYDFGVDVEMYSHEHQYERFLPIYDGRVYNGTQEDPYRNAGAPVHIISGSAGCQEKLDPFKGQPATGSVKQISDYGFTKVRASRCKIEFEQISDDQAGTVVDKFVLSKSKQNFPSAQDQQIIEGC